MKLNIIKKLKIQFYLFFTVASKNAAKFQHINGHCWRSVPQRFGTAQQNCLMSANRVSESKICGLTLLHVCLSVTNVCSLLWEERIVDNV